MRIVATFLALAAALAGQAGEAGAQADTFLSELKAACREEWGTDYQMVEYCQNKQIEAMNAVARIQAEGEVGRNAPRNTDELHVRMAAKPRLPRLADGRILLWEAVRGVQAAAISGNHPQMHIFVGIIGFLAILFGVIVFVNGASAIHEIEGLLACGFGGLFLGLSSIDRHLWPPSKKNSREEAGPEKRVQRRMPATRY